MKHEFKITVDPEEEWMTQELAQSLLGQEFSLLKVELAVGVHSGRHINVCVEKPEEEAIITAFLKGYRRAILKNEEQVRSRIERDIYPVTETVKSGSIWRYEIVPG